MPTNVKSNKAAKQQSTKETKKQRNKAKTLNRTGSFSQKWLELPVVVCALLAARQVDHPANAKTLRVSLADDVTALAPSMANIR